MTLLAKDPDAAVAVTATRQAAPTAAPTTGELTARLGEQLSRLIRDELALAQTEATQRAKRVGIGLGMFGAGGMFAFFGACCTVAATVIGLSNVLRPWFAALVVAAALFFVALLTVLPGWKGVTERRPPIPRRTAESLKADVDAVKHALKHEPTSQR